MKPNSITCCRCNRLLCVRGGKVAFVIVAVSVVVVAKLSLYYGREEIATSTTTGGWSGAQSVTSARATTATTLATDPKGNSITLANLAHYTCRHLQLVTA